MEMTFSTLRRSAAGAVAAATLVLAGCQSTRPVPFDASMCPPPVAASAPVPPVPVAPAPVATRPPRIGLALGGGAARGFAHIGVIQVLEENGIHPDLVAGTSAGSLVAALYASGKTGPEMANLALTMDESAITDWSFPGRGLIRGDALARYVREQVGGRNIEQMKLPLGIVATDLSTGNPILFQRGDVGLAVRASSAVPAVFVPVKIGTHEYVDGGLVAPVPVRYARQMGADVVIAIDISQDPEGGPTGDPMHMLLQTFSIMGRSLNAHELKEADIVLRPKLSAAAGTDFTLRKQTIQAGRDAALAALAKIREKAATPVPVVAVAR
jgi:NTE family protein